MLSAAKLVSLNPVAVIARGYSMATLHGEVLVSTKNVRVGDKVELVLQDGQLACSVEEIRQKG
jgi:exodeoxyribonuclease VII large subunit